MSEHVTSMPALLFAGDGHPRSLPWETVSFLSHAAQSVRPGVSISIVLWAVGERLHWALRRTLEGCNQLEFREVADDVSPASLLEPTLRGEDSVRAIVFDVSRAREVLAYLDGVDARHRPQLVPESIDLRGEVVAWELARLYELTRVLRRECPWDRKQTQQDIVTYTLEEAYELVDAVRGSEDRPEKENRGAVAAELGDLLFQVYFLACVAEQEGWYDLGDVAAAIEEKLVRRHPHIFAGATADTPDDVRRTWEEIKRHTEGRRGIFHDVPAAFPATLLAQKLQQRAAGVGFDWRDARQVVPKIQEELAELEEILEEVENPEAGEPTLVRLGEEVGDLLFAAVNLARKVGVDPELSLRMSSWRFQRRVEAAAALAENEGKVFASLPLDEQDEYYQRVKAILREEPE